MNPEVQELQPKLKEILYDCAVDIRATKAALFLYDGNSRFELVTEYGFRGAIRRSADRNDPIVDRCGRGRSPFFINGLAAEPRFSEVLYEASTDRLLAAPVYSRGGLVGIIDMRDKAARAPFDNSDLPKAQHIAERIAEVFARTNVFGQRFLTVSGAPEAAPVTSGLVAVIPANLQPSSVRHSPSSAAASPFPAPPVASPPVAAPPVAAPPPLAAPSPAAPPVAAPPLATPALAAPPPRPPVLLSSRSLPIEKLVLDARETARRVIAARPAESLGETELAAVRDFLPGFLLIPGALAALFTAFDGTDGAQEIVSRGLLTDAATTFLQGKLTSWLLRHGESGATVRVRVQPASEANPSPIVPGLLQKVYTAPVTIGSVRSLYLTVAFSSKPDRGAHELLAKMLGHLQSIGEASLERGKLQTLRFRAADALLEPDFTKYPELRLHSDRVVSRAESLARHLAMSQAEVDDVKLVARVHDSGMRLLDYDALYRKVEPTAREMSLLREHTVLGAALTEPLLGNDIARAVLCHHERWDGRGYPNRLRGDDIPRLSRVVQLCDVYETMVAPDNGYQPPVPRSNALAMIAQQAGEQFDAEVAHRFLEMMR